MRAAALILMLALCGAACRGHAMKVDANQAFPDVRIAELANAAANGHAAEVRTLVQQGADPNAHGDRDVTPLQFAIMSESPAGAEALLQAGADPNEPGLGGATPVHVSAMMDDPQYLKLLLDHRADPNVRRADTQAVPLSDAAGPRTDAQFRMLLAAGADPGLADRTGNTPLHTTAMINAGAQVLLLLEKGASPSAKNAQDATFQRYFFKLPASRLTPEAKANRDAVIAWLRAHQVPLEANVE